MERPGGPSISSRVSVAFRSPFALSGGCRSSGGAVGVLSAAFVCSLGLALARAAAARLLVILVRSVRVVSCSWGSRGSDLWRGVNTRAKFVFSTLPSQMKRATASECQRRPPWLSLQVLSLTRKHVASPPTRLSSQMSRRGKASFTKLPS